MSNPNELTILNYFQEKGLTRAQAAGIVGNIMQESGADPNAPGGGLIQGQGGRTSSGSLQQQLNGIWRELSGTYQGALHNLQRTNTPEAAARVFSEQFEQPGTPELAKRERYAHEAYIGQTSGLFGGGGGPFSFGAGESPGEILDPTHFGTFTHAAGAVGETASGIVGAGEGLLKSGEAAGRLAGALLEPGTWLRIAEGIGGIVLIYMGLSTLSRRGGARDVIGTTRQASSTPRKVAKAAAAAAVA